MHSFFRLVTLTLALALLLPLALQQADLTSTGVARAQQGEEAPRRVQPMTERTYRRLAEAQEMLDEENHSGAIAHLQNLLNSRGLNPAEQGQIHNMLAFAHFQTEQYQEAIRHYEAIVALGENVPRGLELGTLYSLAQLYYLVENYSRALDYMEMWLARSPEPGPEPYAFIGTLHYQNQDFTQAIEFIERAIDIAQQRGTAIRENWWQLLLFLNFEQENFARSIEILETLVRDFPKREYWMQLAGLYGQQGEEKKQVQAFEAAYVAGFVEHQTDFLGSAGLLVQEQVPYRAAKRLEEGMEAGVVEENFRNLQQLAQAWQLAQEVDRAIPVYERAAELSDDGEIYSRLAGLFLEKDDFDACVSNANDALEKGDLRDRSNTMMVRSMCLYNDGRLGAAREGFQACARAARQDDNASMERACQQWVTHVDREAARLQRLQAGS